MQVLSIQNNHSKHNAAASAMLVASVVLVLWWDVDNINNVAFVTPNTRVIILWSDTDVITWCDCIGFYFQLSLEVFSRQY